MMIIDKIAEVRMRMNRGVNLTTEIKNMIYITTALKLFFELEIRTAIMLCPVVLVLYFLVGMIDMDWIKLLQTEKRIDTEKYNPVFKRWNKKLRCWL